MHPCCVGMKELAHSKTLCIELHILERPVGLCWPVKVATGPTWLRYFKFLRQEQSIYIVKYYAVSIQNYCKYTWFTWTYGRDHSFPRKPCFPVRIPFFSTPPKKLSQVFHSVLVAPSPYTDKKKEKEKTYGNGRVCFARSCIRWDSESTFPIPTLSRMDTILAFNAFRMQSLSATERTNEKREGRSRKPSFFCKQSKPPSTFPFRRCRPLWLRKDHSMFEWIVIEKIIWNAFKSLSLNSIQRIWGRGCQIRFGSKHMLSQAILDPEPPASLLRPYKYHPPDWLPSLYSNYETSL